MEDLIKGKMKFPESDEDFVLLKKDGIPTYHFAHAVDDHFMRTTIAVRGEEWIPSSALHLDLFNALGFTKEEMKKPMVGIVSSYNEIVPGHMNIDKIVDAVKLGVAMAGGTPIVFPAIAVCDGIAMCHNGMKYSLITRDLIADST